MLRMRESTTPATRTSLEDLERRFGLSLPQAYRDFLIASNGGRPERDLVLVPGNVGSPHARIHFFFGVGARIESYDLAWNIEACGDLPGGLVPIATTEGADMLCLNPSGEVVFWDGYERTGYPVATSFDDLLKKLYRDDLSPVFDESP